MENEDQQMNKDNKVDVNWKGRNQSQLTETEAKNIRGPGLETSAMIVDKNIKIIEELSS